MIFPTVNYAAKVISNGVFKFNKKMSKENCVLFPCPPPPPSQKSPKFRLCVQYIKCKCKSVKAGGGCG